MHEQADAVVHEYAADGGLGLDLGELELGVLEVRQLLAKHLALGCIVHGLGQHRLHHRGRANRLRKPLLRQVFHHELEATAFGAEQVASRDVYVFKEQLGRILGFHAQLFQVAPALEAGARCFDDKQRYAGRPACGFGLGGKHDHIAQLAVRDEHFLATDHVAVGAAHGTGVDVAQIAAGMRLGHAEGADGLASHHFRQPGLLLLFAAKGVDVRDHHFVVH